jgi:hypothetical protein
VRAYREERLRADFDLFDFELFAGLTSLVRSTILPFFHT